MPRRVALILSALALFTLGCNEKAGPGSRCYAHSDCVEGTRCFELGGTGSVCLELCTGASAFCGDGEVCVPGDDDPGIHACLLGGDTIIGDQCEESWECERGGVCVEFADPPAKYCRLACEPTNDGFPCQSSLGQTCVGECADGAIGYCSVDPSATPACPAGGPDAGTGDAGP